MIASEHFDGPGPFQVHHPQAIEGTEHLQGADGGSKARIAKHVLGQTEIHRSHY